MNNRLYKIQDAFNHAKDSYDDFCDMQIHTHLKLWNQLLHVNNHPRTTVDLGCGTGNCCEKLKILSENNHYTGIDISDQLLETARYKLPNEIFLQQDMCSPITENNTVDLFYANMSIQWVSCLNRFFKTLFMQQNNNGLFAFCLPIHGSFCEIPAHLRNTFYTKQAITDALTHAQYALIYEYENTIVKSFLSKEEALQSIKNIGANCLVNPGPFEKKRYSTHTLTYKIGYFIARKP